MSGNTKGSCLCGEVIYQITGNIGIFQYCHYSRCRKFTGSAHAANLFVSSGQFSWLKGESLLGRFSPPQSKHFATAFCTRCGSSLPWLAKSAKVVIVPAGTLDTHPGIEPTQNIFCVFKATWYVPPNELPQYNALLGKG